MPLALLLSPDDQAVSAITAVLEEMSVTCERPLDGVSAAKQLNSASFDLVLVDCENLPAAKLIFDVCRRGKDGSNPIPIAIVDGRAGLPTAFRLGAELILTKPVAKDQARTTIRSAVGRVKKDEPEHGSVAPEAPSPEHANPVEAEADPTTSALLTNYEISSNSSAVSPSTPATAAATAFSSASSFTGSVSNVAELRTESPVSAVIPKMAMSAAVPAPAFETTPAAKIPSAPTSIAEVQSTPTPSLSAVAPPSVTGPTPAADDQLGEDPVVVELERAEAEAANPQPSAPAKSSEPPATGEQPGIIFSSYSENKGKSRARGENENKSRGPLVAMLVLVLAGGGLYGAWMYQPGFRELAQPQMDRLLALVGIEHPAKSQTPVPIAAKPAVPPVTVATPASGAQTSPSTTPDASAPSSTPAGLTSTTPSFAAPTSTQAATAGTAGSTLAAPMTSTPTSSSPAAPPNSTPTTSPSTATPAKASAPAAPKAEPAKSQPEKATTKPSGPSALSTAASSSEAELPGEKTAIILSSKGAEKRLAHSVQPTYPAGARAAEGEGTMVLKAVIDENGKVTGARLVEGSASLAPFAIKAIKQWRYRPYVRDGKNLPFQTVVIIDFQRP